MSVPDKVYDPHPLPSRQELRAQIRAAGVTDGTELLLIEHLVLNNRLPAQHIPAFVGEVKASSLPATEYALAYEPPLINEEELANVFSAASAMPLADFTYGVEAPVADLLDGDLALRLGVLPYTRDNRNRVLVAIADPQDKATLDAVKKALHRHEVEFRLAPTHQLRDLVAKTYQAGDAGVERLVRQVVQETAPAEAPTLRVDEDDETGIMRMLADFINRGHAQGASDIHLRPRREAASIEYRLDGLKREITRVPLPIYLRLVSALKNAAGLKIDQKRKPQGARWKTNLSDGSSLDIRVSVIPTLEGEKITMRLLDPEKARQPLEKSGMSDENIQRFIDGVDRASGCAIITGPTGSGKSTTLHATLQRIYVPEREFVAIEDPVEFTQPNITQMDVSGWGTESVNFAEALRETLRADPDVILVGEIRDNETAEIAIQAADTGHFLFTTLHTNTALGAVSRLSVLGVHPAKIAEVVKVLMAQRLVRRLCLGCREAFELSVDELPEFAPDWLREREEPLRIYRAKPEGCATCEGRGYKGRVGVFEVILLNDELREGIENGMTLREMEQRARAAGMRSLLDDAITKVLDGVTSLEEVRRTVV